MARRARVGPAVPLIVRPSILLVEQYYDFARSLADQYLVMERGEIIARGRGENMDAEGVKGLLAV
jgi:urea transport system ATP-binding protein